MKNITVNCENIEISNNNKICLIAGPCQLETEQHAMDMAGKIKEIAKKFNIGFIYKTSFDKANRTSLKGKRGAGLDKSLPIFDKIKTLSSFKIIVLFCIWLFFICLWYLDVCCFFYTICREGRFVGS